MAARMIIPQMLKCRSCQFSTYSAFAASGEVGLPRISNLTEARSLRLAPRRSQRRFSDQQAGQLESNSEPPSNDEPLIKYTALAPSASEETSALPWYLKVQKPQQLQSAFPERQQIPDLPPDAPPTLLPILEHLSNGIGLDYITLLDLRNLDPPPALGSDLIMVFGTARSEKHLHISADRFARWLRTQYKLRPYADGLLGRNELKLKMRRKNKRAKLLSNVGGVAREDTDDGIRTSWVCVNVGTIDGDNSARILPRDDSFIGFGGQVEGVKLVVQMMTEERRSELDLETLWGGYLARQERKAARDKVKSIAEGLDVEVRSDLPDSTTRAESFSPLSSSMRTFEAQSPSLSRGFHTSTRQLRSIPTSPQPLDGASQNGGKMLMVLAELQVADEPNGKEPRALGTINHGSDSVAICEDLFKYLQTLARAEAIQNLGYGNLDYCSTEFLRNFYTDMPLFLSSEHWSLRVSLVAYGLDLEHQGYTKKDLLHVFHEMQLAGVKIPHSVYERVLCSLLRISTDEAFEDVYIRSAVDILEDMSARLLFPLSHNIAKAFLLAATHGEASTQRQHASESLGRLIHGYPLGFDEQDHMDTLQLLAKAHHWLSFWSYWGNLTFQGGRRSEVQYTGMFRIVAEQNNQRECTRALATHLPEIHIEDPPVLLSGPLAQTVIQCLKVVEPSIEHLVHHTAIHSQWSEIWRKCVIAVEEKVFEEMQSA